MPCYSKKILLSGLVLWGCLPGTLAPRSSFKIPWVRMPMNSKGRKNYSCLTFHCLQFHAISFSSSARILVRLRDLIEQNNWKQRTRLSWRSSLYRNKLAKVSDTLEACYHNDQAEKRKITNAYKVFFFLSLRASGMMLSLQMVLF